MSTTDAESYEFEYDPYGRLRRVNNQSSGLVAEFKYNGLGHMVAVHEDTDTDGDVDASDKWFYPVHDERWRIVANYREDDSDPKEEWIPHQGGNSGNGLSFYINSVICRAKDANTAWTTASDGTLEQRFYYCQNWRGDVSALVKSASQAVEWVKYEGYGMPVGLPGGDADSDGDCDATDLAQIQTWIDLSSYDIRGDLDLDGDVDTTDKEIATNQYQGEVAGRGVMSVVGNRLGYGGYYQGGSTPLAGCRLRVLDPSLGAWLRRDPMVYEDGLNLYAYVAGQPMTSVDPDGALSLATGPKTSGWVKGNKHQIGYKGWLGEPKVSQYIVCEPTTCSCLAQGNLTIDSPWGFTCTLVQATWTSPIPCPQATADMLGCQSASGSSLFYQIKCCSDTSLEASGVRIGYSKCSTKSGSISTCVVP